MGQSVSQLVRQGIGVAGGGARLEGGGALIYPDTRQDVLSWRQLVSARGSVASGGSGGHTHTLSKYNARRGTLRYCVCLRIEHSARGLPCVLALPSPEHARERERDRSPVLRWLLSLLTPTVSPLQCFPRPQNEITRVLGKDFIG